MKVKTESRICFALDFYDDEREAEEAGRKVAGTYNGGFYHGRKCGREPGYDYEASGDGLYGPRKLYAVSRP